MHFPFKRKTFQTLNIVHLDSDALLENYDYIHSLNAEYQVFPTIKWNAYGHGIQEVATILKQRKLSYICVDSYYEALKVREVNATPVLIMGYTLPHNYCAMKLKNFTFFVYDSESIHALWKLKKRVKIHLKIDTGMSRQWVRKEEVQGLLDIIKKYPTLELEGIATHLADADNIDNSYSIHQIKEFKAAIWVCEHAGYSLKYIHISNTAGSMKFHSLDFNAVRFGLGLYGINPFEQEDAMYHLWEKLKPVLSLDTTLVARKHIKKWEKVSYNCTFTAPHDMVIGVVPIGYYEGLSRKLSSNYTMYYKGQELAVIGRVCMNLTMLDLGHCPVSVWERIEVISQNRAQKNNVYELAKKSETIPYEVLTRISETIRREII